MYILPGQATWIHREIYVYISIYISISLYTYLYLYLSIYLYIYIHIFPICQATWIHREKTIESIFIYLSIYLSVYLTVYLYTYLPLSIDLSIDLYLYITLYLIYSPHQATWIHREKTIEGESSAKMSSIELNHWHSSLYLPQTITHTIDETSPFFKFLQG